MPWDEATLRLEIAVELGSYDSAHDLVSDVLHARHASTKARCRRNTRERRKDPRLKAHDLTTTQAWRAKAKELVRDRVCGCGKVYATTHLHRSNGRDDHACSECRRIESRKFRLYTMEGRTMTAQQWARERGIRPAKVQDRLRRGWSFERALGFP